MAKYNVYWDERHSVIVEAKNEEEAKDKACAGEVLSDEAADMNGGMDAEEIKE